MPHSHRLARCRTPRRWPLQSPGALALAAMLAALIAAASPSRAQIVVGVAGPATGRMAEAGRAQEAGVAEAVAAINAAGGLLGERLIVVAADDGCQAGMAGAAAHELITSGAVLVVGHICGNAAAAAARIYGPAGVMMITTARHPAITEKPAPEVLRLAGRDDRQGHDIGMALAARHGPEHPIAIIHDRTAYGRALAGGVTAALQAAGRQPVLEATIISGEKDYSATVRAVIAAGARTLVLGAYPAEGGAILRQLRAAGSTVDLVGGDAMAAVEFWDATGPVGEGTRVALPASRMAEGGLARAAIEAWTGAVRAAATTDTGKVAAALRVGRWPTVAGPISFDAAGNASVPSFELRTWRSGRLVAD